MDTLKLKEENQTNITVSGDGTCASWIYNSSDGSMASSKPLQRGETESFEISGHGRLMMGFIQTDEDKLNISDYRKVPNLMTVCADVKNQIESKRVSIILDSKVKTTCADFTKSVDYDQRKFVFICFNLLYGDISLQATVGNGNGVFSGRHGTNILMGEIIRLKNVNPFSICSLSRPLENNEKVRFVISPMPEDYHIPKTFQIKMAASSHVPKDEKEWAKILNQKGSLTFENRDGILKYCFNSIQNELVTGELNSTSPIWFQLFRATLKIENVTRIPVYRQEETHFEDDDSSYDTVEPGIDVEIPSPCPHNIISNEFSDLDLQSTIRNLKSVTERAKYHIRNLETNIDGLNTILFAKEYKPQRHETSMNVQSFIDGLETQIKNYESRGREMEEYIKRIKETLPSA